MMGSNRNVEQRSYFNFENIVKATFMFLHELGFAEIDSTPTLVRYRKGDIEVNVFHGRQSYDIGFEIVRNGERYSLSELIRATDPEAAKQYRNFSATTQEGVAEGLTQLADLAKRYGDQALRGDQKFFSTLETQRTSWGKDYALEVLAGQLRPKADVAFREGNYAEAAELYSRIQPLLSPTEVKKLAVAKKRSGG